MAPPIGTAARLTTTWGNAEQALADCHRAIELNPDDASAYGCRGRIYQETGKYDWAIRDCTRAIELNQEIAYYDRARAYGSLGRYAEAIKDGEMYLKLAPNSSGADEIRRLIADWEKRLGK